MRSNTRTAGPPAATEGHGHSVAVPAAGRRKALPLTSLAVTAAAVAGSLAASPASAWYAALRKPSWQPPRAAFPLVWTPLYALIAVAGARAIDRSDAPVAGQPVAGTVPGSIRRPDTADPALVRSFATNLILNAAWTPLFFAARAPRLALAEILLLNVSNVDLIGRAWRIDRTTGLMLAPYGAWTLFATALNMEIVRRNP